MKKSLVALAVIGAFTAQAAMADGTTIYGSGNVSFDAVSNGNKVSSASANALSSNASNFGLKGKEDLGDGLSAVWQIEEGINFASSGNTTNTGNTNFTGNNSAFAGNSNFQARDTFVGLSSATLGTALAGIHDTPYKLATRGMDVFADTIGDNRSLMGKTGIHDARLNNVLAYISPAMNGFTIAIAGVTGAELPVANSTKGNAWSLAALYGAGPINASLAYQTITVGTVGTGTLAAGNIGGVGAVNDKTTAWKIGGSYNFGAASVNAVYEKLTYNVAAAGIDAWNQGNFYLSGKYNVTANDAIKLAYTSAGKNNNGTAAQVANTAAKQWTVGYDHTMSKRTSVYALYSKLSNDSLATYNLGNADANSSTASSNGIAGSSPSVFSLGIKHAF